MPSLFLLCTPQPGATWARLMVKDDETPVVAPPAPGLSPVKMVLGLVVLIGLNYVFTDLLDESVRRSSPLRL